MKRQNVEKSERQDGTKRMPPWLRRVGVVVIFLLAGAIINVLVAWAGAAFAPFDVLNSTHAYQLSQSGEWWVTRFHGRAGSIAMSARPDPIDDQESLEDYTSTPTCDELWPSWAGIAAEDISERINVGGFGWPSVALAWTAHMPAQGQFDITNGIRTNLPGIRESRLQRRGSLPRVLPLRIVPFGFLVNTVLYGALAWVLFAAPWVMQRHRRSMRNRCPDCGYDLRGADHGKCPECGEAVR